MTKLNDAIEAVEIAARMTRTAYVESAPVLSAAIYPYLEQLSNVLHRLEALASAVESEAT